MIDIDNDKRDGRTRRIAIEWPRVIFKGIAGARTREI